MVEDRVQRNVRLRGRARSLIARVRVRAGKNAGQVRPAAFILHQQRQVAAIVEVDLGPVDRAQPERAGGDGELHRARDRVVIGQREGVIPEPDRRSDHVLGQRGPVEERERGVAVKLSVRQGEHMFALGADGMSRVR